VTKLQRKYERESEQNSANLQKSYLRKTWRKEECTPVCEEQPGSLPILIPSPRVAARTAEMNHMQRATRNFQHFQTNLKLFEQRPADLNLKTLMEPGFNPPKCDDQPADRTQTGPRQTAGLGHLLDQEWTGEGRTRLT
jgi:hypothetical protein